LSNSSEEVVDNCWSWGRVRGVKSILFTRVEISANLRDWHHGLCEVDDRLKLSFAVDERNLFGINMGVLGVIAGLGTTIVPCPA
jgi:hypothetical protein